MTESGPVIPEFGAAQSTIFGKVADDFPYLAKTPANAA